MGEHKASQVFARVHSGGEPVTYETVVPNPKLKLLDQMKEVMRLKHYSLKNTWSGSSCSISKTSWRDMEPSTCRGHWTGSIPPLRANGDGSMYFQHAICRKILVAGPCGDITWRRP
jgi:hypothetical protein